MGTKILQAALQEQAHTILRAIVTASGDELALLEQMAASLRQVDLTSMDKTTPRRVRWGATSVEASCEPSRFSKGRLPRFEPLHKSHQTR